MIFEKEELDRIMSSCVIDLTYLGEFSHGDKAFEKEMLESSLSETDEQIALLQTFIATRNVAQICKMAHALKSVMAVMGAGHLHTYFHKIEQSRMDYDMSAEQVSQLQLSAGLWHTARNALQQTIATFDC